MLIKSRAFTAVALLSIALGIGANTTVFSVINAVLLKSLPYKDPNTLVLLWGDSRTEGDRRKHNQVSATDVADFRSQASVFEDVTTYSGWNAIMSGGSEPERVPAIQVGDGFFKIMKGKPLLGRVFTPEEQEDGKDFVIVLSYGLWQRRFGGDPNIVGETVSLSGRPYNVVGVMDADFHPLPSTLVFPEGQFYRPVAEAYDDSARDERHLRAIARLKPGVSVEQARTEANIIAQRLEREHPLTNKDQGAEVVSITDEIVGGIRPTLLMIFGAVLFVLLVACANVANLLLARALRRRREIGVRLALGAGRRRLLRQLLTESTLLALFGASAGLLVAHFGGGVLRRTLLADVDWSATGLFDRRILLFTLVCALITGITTGLIPALQAGRTDLTGALKAGGREGSRPGSRIRTTLLVVQAALSVVLLVGAGLFVRSLRNVNAVDLGYEPGRLLQVSTDFRGTALKPAERNDLQRRLLERARAIPGVQSAAATFGVPFWASLNEDIFVPGHDSVSRLGAFYLLRVGGDYFATAGTPILRGRALTEADRTGGPPVAVVSETMARRVWPGEEAIGKCIKVDADTMPCSAIVGIAKDVRWGSLGDDDRMQHYHPMPADGRGWLYVRTNGDPKRLIEPLRRSLQQLMPGTAFVTVGALSSTLDPVLRPFRLGATMFTLFGALALVVAAIGLYGVIAYSVAQRMHEMGVRVALGARTGDLLRLVVWEGLRVALVGIVLGAAGSLAAGRLVASLLFGVPSNDPLTFIVVALVLLAVATVASLVPAWRASRVDPNLALRAE
jgi:putative ABC transport system permease protein